MATGCFLNAWLLWCAQVTGNEQEQLPTAEELQGQTIDDNAYHVSHGAGGQGTDGLLGWGGPQWGQARDDNTYHVSNQDGRGRGNADCFCSVCQPGLLPLLLDPLIS